jgi:ElaB/YqjD/DUF883 family membrane-anchored ribosome-binding protein
MEEIVRDVVNIGLGAAEKIKSIAAGESSLNFTIEELKEKGAANESEVAVKIRDSVDDTLKKLQDLRQKVDAIVSEGQQRFSDTLASLNLPGINIEDLKSNFDNYASLIQERLNELFERIKPMLDNVKIDELQEKVDEIILNIRGAAPNTKETPSAKPSSKGTPTEEDKPK